MAIDLSQKLMPTIGMVAIKNADGSPMLDGDGKPAFARMHTPASKTWEVAHASQRRKSMRRVREHGGRIEAVADDLQDTIEFLVAVTEEFVNVAMPLPEGQTGAKALVRAIYENPQLGYIRDQMEANSKDWGAFLDQSESN
ncbi:hypothetical protein [Novosphingobium sp. KN65.2]|uniref:hypothetical protein n=1 Tax=Novosphingobium sp. KN65.2 TaxID=1478134 RepID=UPI0005E88894|nr:hypothetical protein [Novosphingobium sp. KN65.2]CDO34995.1 conserved hypothetical protein [Novosphingobium sp. KN65.2]